MQSAPATSKGRLLPRAIGAGVIAGIVSAGLGGRVVMRLIAIIDPSTKGAFTDAEATVGDFTVEGTIQIFVLGAILGAVAGLVYLGLRRWLPVPPAWRGAAYGALTLVTVGQPLFDPANVDFQIFEPLILVVALFAVLFLINGVLVARLLDSWHPEPAYTHSAKVLQITAIGVGVVFVLGAVLFAGNTIRLTQDQGTCLSAVGGGNGCAIPSE